MIAAELASLIDRCLSDLGMSAAEASRRAVGNHYLISNLKQGKSAMPSVENLEALCDVLGLEFYIGPPRTHENLNQSPFNSDEKTANAGRLRASDVDEAWYMLAPQLDGKLTAGHSKPPTDEAPTGILAFRREWMRVHHLRLGYVSTMEMQGDGMTPFLNDGDVLLINHARTKRARGQVVVARVGGDLFVKRLERTPGGEWLLVSDNHEYAPIALPETGAVLGEIVWRGRWLR